MASPRTKIEHVIGSTAKITSQNAQAIYTPVDKKTLTSKCYYVERTGPGLASAYELTIIDDCVVRKRRLNNGDDLPGFIISDLEAELWEQYRGNRQCKI